MLSPSNQLINFNLSVDVITMARAKKKSIKKQEMEETERVKKRQKLEEKEEVEVEESM